MQINHDFKPVLKSSANMETAQASIAMTAHMFQILSAGIYQHPERAVIREPSCNAYDAQVEAGTAHIPFKVHLPMQLEPYFEVRDFGTGMTHEQVMKLYLTYGASTKRDTNDQIGGLGIGSKAPFAIAQSFTVTSYKDGIVRRYSVYMEEGVPQVTKLTESKTDEPNGVAVRVAVPLDKIDKFHQEANLVYTHFPVKPDCNRPLVNIYEDLPVLTEEKDRFKIFSGDNRTSNMSIKTGIVMGNIEYPIVLADVVPDLDTVMPQFLRRNITHALIYLPIGSVNIAASRETLQLSDSTKVMIKQVFTDISQETLQSFQAKISAAKNLAEAAKIFREAVGENAYSQKSTFELMKHITYDGKTLFEWMEEQDECRMTEVIDPTTGQVVTDHLNRPKKCFKYQAIMATRLRSLRPGSTMKKQVGHWNECFVFSLFRGMTHTRLMHSVFLIEDRFTKNGKPKAAGRDAILRKIAEEQFARFQNPGLDYEAHILSFKSLSEIKELAALHHYPLDEITILKTSDYEQAYVPKKAVRGNVKLWVAEDGYYKETDVDLDTFDNPQYYIRAQGCDIVTEGFSGSCELREAMQHLSTLMPEKRLFMFRKAVWNKIPEEWVELSEDVFEDLLKENPHWWVKFNRYHTRQVSSGRHPNLSRMEVKLVSVFNKVPVRDGYVSTIAERGKTGVNFEDNLDVFHVMFGRPQLIFADLFYKTPREVVEICSIERFLSSKTKLRKKISAASLRARDNVSEEFKRYEEKNKLLSWIDWSTVSFREVATYLGHTLTPYVDK